MPCQCGTVEAGAPGADAAGGCDCGTGSDAGCGCGTTPSPSDYETSLERVVMELDKRVRRLEAQRHDAG